MHDGVFGDIGEDFVGGGVETRGQFAVGHLLVDSDAGLTVLVEGEGTVVLRDDIGQGVALRRVASRVVLID